MQDKYDKLHAYIELLNNGLKPKNYDPVTIFSNGTKVNQYWAKNRSKIITELNTNPIYNSGYEVAKKTVSDYMSSLIKNRLKEYIELLNNGIITPSYNDETHEFKDGQKIKYFWSNNKDKIISLLNTDPKYNRGYEIAKEAIKKYLLSLNQDKISEYIELLNNGLIPTSNDSHHTFKDGTKINKFWSNNKDKIINELTTNPKYNSGYEVAKSIISNYLASLNYDKISNYIELLNKKVITPKSCDRINTFSNGEPINYFWNNHNEDIINELNTNPKYNSGYEVAKEVITKYLESLNIDKISEYIELINQELITISYYDPKNYFSNGEPINHFFKTNKEKIINELNNNPKYQTGYEKAKESLKKFLNKNNINYIDEYINLLNNGILIPSTYELTISFSNGRLINRFWSHKKEEIIKELNTNPKYQTGYEKAKEVITKYLESLNIDKISEYIELLNKKIIKIKYNDSTHFFSNNDPINTFWSNNKENIFIRITTDPKYKIGYSSAIKEIMKHYHKVEKIHEYIELLNNGYIPKDYENTISFSNGELIKDFWFHKKNKFHIAYELNHNPKYTNGYEKAKKTINDLTNLINSLGGNESRATKIYQANKKLNKKRREKENLNPPLSRLLEEFNIDINTLNTFLNRTTPSKKNQPHPIMYKGETLKSYCLRNGYNYTIVYRILKIYKELPNKSFNELIPLALDTYRKKGQNKPTMWVYEKYGVLLKHLLLLINIDSNGILYNMKKYCMSLEEAMRHEIFKRNIPNKKYKWLEELYNYLISTLDSNKKEDELTTEIANKFYILNKEYSLTEEERSILFNLLEKYIISIRKYLAYSCIFESNEELRVKKALDYQLSFTELEDAYFNSLRIQNKTILPLEHPLIKHLQLLKVYYLYFSSLPKEDQEYIIKKENLSSNDIKLMLTLKENITNLINKIKEIKNQPKH